MLKSKAGSWIPISMAIDKPPFDDVRVRQAMRLIVDREEMVQRVLSGYGLVGNDLYGEFDAGYRRLPAARAGHRPGQVAARRGRPGEPDASTCSPRTTPPGSPTDRRVRRPGDGGRGHRQRQVDGANYWGDEYIKRTFATSFWGTRPTSTRCRRSLKNSTYPETHWPPEGSDFEDLYKQALAETDDDGPLRDHPGDAAKEYEKGGYIIPFFNNLLDATARTSRVRRPAERAQPRHFGRGFSTSGSRLRWVRTGPPGSGWGS